MRLQILMKRIIVDPQGATIEHELHSPFVYLCALVEHLSALESGDGSSEHVRLGVLSHKSNFPLRFPSTHNSRAGIDLHVLRDGRVQLSHREQSYLL
jgi:hypothetical protein